MQDYIHYGENFISRTVGMNVKDIKNCYGCGLCAVVCARRVINIDLNASGFYEPHIAHPDKCTDCGLCVEVCSFNKDGLCMEQPKEVQSYAAWSNDVQVRSKCSSGGVGFELGRKMMEKGYRVCVVRYNAEAARAEHYIATTPRELISGIGSKYIQSYTVDAFRAINRKEKYLVTGTPCQIDSFRRYIRKFHVEENFVLMDFFCHSVPSMLAWRKYLQIVERQVGKVTYAAWRNKQTGWHDSWAMTVDGERCFGDKVEWHDSYNMLIRGKKSCFYSRLSQGDIFYKLFLGDYCVNPACRKECKYKYRASSADIRIGDFWGDTYAHDEDGVSATVAFTPCGNEILKSLDCTLTEHPFETVAEGQMHNNCKQAYLAGVVMNILENSSSKLFNNRFLWSCLFKTEGVLRLPQKVICKLTGIIKGVNDKKTI